MIVGKNTVVNKAIALTIKAPKEGDKSFEIRKDWFNENANLEKLIPLLAGKVGLIFSDSPVYDIKPIIEGNRKPAAAKVGMVAPIDVNIVPGPTGMDPSQIGFFHALNMSTKINKGQIEITKDVKVCTAGKKVGNSEAVLLQKLNIKPFNYGMEIYRVYDDGTVLTPEIFNMNPADILSKFKKVADKIAAISLAIHRPNQLSAPHLIVNQFKNIASIALASNISFKLLKNLTSSGPAPSGKADKKADDKKPDAKPVVEEKPVEDAPMDMGGMFDDF